LEDEGGNQGVEGATGGFEDDLREEEPEGASSVIRVMRDY
jgi:hypothetical protein